MYILEYTCSKFQNKEYNKQLNRQSINLVEGKGGKGGGECGG